MRKAFNAREISLIRRISPAIYVTLALILGSWPVSAQEVGQAGVVTFANGASIGIATASNGSTIFSGDLLKMGEAGRLQIQSGTMQFVLEARDLLQSIEQDLIAKVKVREAEHGEAPEPTLEGVFRGRGGGGMSEVAGFAVVCVLGLH